MTQLIQAARRALLRKQAVLAALGESNTQLYHKINLGLITKPVKIGPRAAAWPDDEISAITDARIAGKSATEIRAVVDRLHAARKEALVTA